MDISKSKPVHKTLGDIIIRVVVTIWISELFDILASISFSKVVNSNAFLRVKQLIDLMLSAALMVFTSLYVIAYLFRKNSKRQIG